MSTIVSFWKGTSIPDKTLAIVCLLLLVASSTLFYKIEDLLAGDYRLTEEQGIGEGKNNTGDTRRKDRRRFAFLDFRRNEYFGDGDTIFTNNGASCLLRFKSGSYIRIFPNTLITVYKIGNSIEVDLSSGNIEVQTSDQEFIQVSTEDEKIEFYNEPEPVQVNKNSGMPTSFGKINSPTTKNNENDIKKALNSADNNRMLWSRDVINKVRNNDKSKGLKFIKNKYNFEYPIPGNNSVLLLKTSQEIQVVPEERCLSQCVLTIKNDFGYVEVYNFKSPQVPMAKIIAISERELNWTWNYKVDGMVRMQGQFITNKFSKSNFSKAFGSGHNIEVLE